MEKEINEALKEIQSGTTAIHLCGDDYSRIDKFVTNLAIKLKFTVQVDIPDMEDDNPITRTGYEAAVVEWNYGYGQVNFLTREKFGSYDKKVPFANFLETHKDITWARNRIILIRNARHILEGEANRENLAQLQQTIVHLKKYLPGKTVLIYCDEKKFVPDELSSLVYFLDIKPLSQADLEKITKKGSKNVKLAVLNNQNCPATCILNLIEDDDLDVIAAAKEKQPETPEIREELQRNCENCAMTRKSSNNNLVCNCHQSSKFNQLCSDLNSCSFHIFPGEELKCEYCRHFPELVEHRDFYTCRASGYNKSKKGRKAKDICYKFERNQLITP